MWTYGLPMSGPGDRETSCTFVPLNWGTYHKCTFGNSHPLCQALLQQSSLDHILFRQQGIQFLDMQPFHLKRRYFTYWNWPIFTSCYFFKAAILFEIWHSHSDDYKEYCLLWCKTMYFGLWSYTAKMNVAQFSEIFISIYKMTRHHIPTVIFSCLFY